MSTSSSYSWMPGWLRKFLNLDDEMPSYGPSSSYDEPASGYTSSYSAPARPAVTYNPVRTAATYTPPALPPSAYVQPTPPSEDAPRATPSFMSGQTPEEAVRRFSSFSSAPPAAASPIGESGQRPAGPPPLTPRPLGTNGGNGPRPISEAAANGYVQPLGYALRSFVRGALPPQGLEQFTREFRATLTDVWNFYSYWFRFETEDLVNIGRESVDALTGMLPPVGGGTTVSSQPRRIKVSQANGDGEAEVKRPAPPAPTAVFSPTVKADDAVVPPGGKDISAEFAARMAKETAPPPPPSAPATPPPPPSAPSATAAPATPPSAPSAPATPPPPPSAPSAAAAPATPPSAPATPPAPPSASTKPATPPSAPSGSTKPVIPPSARPDGDQSKGGKGKK